jgi:lysophospholipase L1-like esterase
MSPFKLTTLGGSVVEGREDPFPDGRWRGWVMRLAEMLGIPASQVRNLGSYGATTQDVVDYQLGPALLNKSPLIGVEVGTNDLLSDYNPDRMRRNLTAIFGRLSGMDIVVFTATYPDVPANLPVPETFRALLRRRFTEASAMLAEITMTTGALCLDIATSPEWSDPSIWMEDGLHLRPLGHQRFAAAMATLIKDATDLPVAVPARIS